MLKIKNYLLFLFLSALLGACTDNADPTPQEDTLTIGALIPLSGAGTSAGESAAAGLNLALNDINDWLQSINSKSNVEVLVEDTGTDTAVALQKYMLLKENGVRIIIGPYSSSVLAALKPYADADNILLLSPGSVAQSLAIANDNVFRLMPSVNSQGEALAALLRNDSIKVLLPVGRNDIWGQELISATASYFNDANQLIDDAAFYSPGTSDFTTVIASLQNRINSLLQNYQPAEIGIYMLSYGEGYDILKAAVTNIDPQIQWYGTSGFAENKSLTEDLIIANYADSINLSCPAFGLEPSTQNKWQPYLDRLIGSLGRKPEIFAFTTYDALWIAASALQDVNSTAPFDILKSAVVYQANHSIGLTGWTSLNEFDDREWAIYDFWSIEQQGNTAEWEISASYNNATGTLTKY